MREWRSLAHVKWECKYQVVIVPKYRRKAFPPRGAERETGLYGQAFLVERVLRK